MAFLYSIIFYLMVGLRPGVDHYFIFFTVVLLIQLTAVSVAMFAVSLFRDFANAAMVGFAVFGSSNFAGGCFLPANRIPVYVSWVKWISYIVSSSANCGGSMHNRWQFYAYGALNNNEFHGRAFPCQQPSGTTDFSCEQYSGDYQLRISGITLSLAPQLVAMVALIGLFNIATGFIMFFFPTKMKMSKKPQTTIKAPTYAEKDVRKPSTETREGAVISLDHYSLEVLHQRPWGAVHRTTSILKPLQTVFEPRKLNVIM